MSSDTTLLIIIYRLTLWDDPNSSLEKHHLEGWYNANIWSHIVDHGLQSIMELEIVRYVSLFYLFIYLFLSYFYFLFFLRRAHALPQE